MIMRTSAQEYKKRERVLTMKIKFLTRNKTDVLHQMTCDFATFSQSKLFDDIKDNKWQDINHEEKKYIAE